MHGWKGGGGGGGLWEAQSHKDFRLGVILKGGVGTEIKQGSDDDDDDDRGTGTVSDVLLSFSGLVFV